MYKKITYKIRFRNRPELDRITIEDSDLDWAVDDVSDNYFGLMFKYTARWWVPQLGKDIIGTKWVVPGNRNY
jgi:hypothetical protein